jgi:hypothetical protein
MEERKFQKGREARRDLRKIAKTCAIVEIGVYSRAAQGHLRAGANWPVVFFLCSLFFFFF